MLINCWLHFRRRWAPHLSFLRSFLRVYSYLFEAVLCAAGILFSLVLAASENVAPQVTFLPWPNDQQLYWIAGLSILGLILILLAIMGRLRILFFLFSGYIAFVLIRGLFISPRHTFAGPDAARNALLIALGALLAFIGAIPQARRKRA